MWKNISQIYQKNKHWAIDEFLNILNEFQYSKTDMDKYLKQMESVTFHYLQSSIKEKASNVDILMNQKFTHIFNTDKTTGAPRRWKPGDRINEEWKNAKHECEQLLDLFGRMRLSEKDFHTVYFEFDPDAPIIKSREIEVENKDYIILTRIEGERHLQRFRDIANTAFSYAHKEMERAAVSGHIPIYFLALLFVLGFNELVWILEMIIFNPFMLFFMILLGISAFIIWRLKLTPVLMTGVRMFLDEGRQYIKYKLKEEQQKVVPPSENLTQSSKKTNKNTPEAYSKTKID
jgi:hypothetical protein